MTINDSSCLLLVGLFLLSAAASAQEPVVAREFVDLIVLGDSPLTATQESDFAEYLGEETSSYRSELKGISFLSFKDRADIPAETAVSLKSEAESVIAALGFMLKSLEKPMKDPDLYSVYAWTTVARQVSVSMSYMEDLDRWELVDSEWYVGLRVLLPGIYERLIEPKLLTLIMEAKASP